MNVAIIGLGLMGGSLGLALRQRRAARVVAYARRPETRDAALAVGAADACLPTLEAAVREADIAVFCTPVLSIPPLMAQCRTALPRQCVVTDVGSTKEYLQRECTSALSGSGVVFVGSHPMAGSEKTGLEVARADLYEDAVTAVTPGENTPADACRRITELWQAVGARVVRLAPAEHDALVARTSHLPHMVAALLVCVAGRTPGDSTRMFCGPGFRDATRIAAGSPEMWHDIVKSNRGALLGELTAFQKELSVLLDLLERGDYEGVRAFLEQAHGLRARLVPG